MDELGEHFAAGRLSRSEFDLRVDAVQHARTTAELDAPLGDLRPLATGWRDPGLRAHGAVFIGLGGLLFAAWALTSDWTPPPRDAGPGHFWALWLVLAWAAVLALHGLHAHGLVGASGGDGVDPTPKPGAEEGSPASTPEPPGGDERLTRQLADLTPRERQVLTLVAEGLANKQIAARLSISERTARSHVGNVLLKLGLNSRTEAALLAVHSGLEAAARDQPPPAA